jgi:hypothetical protein
MLLKDGVFLIMAVEGELKKFRNLVPVQKVSKKIKLFLKTISKTIFSFFNQLMAAR